MRFERNFLPDKPPRPESATGTDVTGPAVTETYEQGTFL